MAVTQPPPRSIDVGVREIRNNFSRYLDMVIDGVEIVITKQGKPVARVGPPDRPTRIIDEMIASGLITPASEPMTWEPHPIDIGGATVSDLVAEQRR